MTFNEINRKSRSITITMEEAELRALTNLLCHARKKVEFNKEHYKVNADLFTAITILHHGKLPAFELKLISELYQKGCTE